MSDLTPRDDGKKSITTGRIAIWVVVGGIGLYLLASGVIGILTKAQ